MRSAARVFSAGCMLLALAAFSAAPWAQARTGARETSAANSSCAGGYVHEASGFGSIQKVAAKAVTAKVGDVFETGAVFRTGPAEKTILKFADGQIVALGPNSAMRVGRYCYLADSPMLSRSSMELIKGEMRVVTGRIGSANPEAMQIAAGDSLLSLLKSGGADLTVSVNPDPREVGYAAVARGEISLSTPYGPIYRISANQYAPWQPGRSPQPAIPYAAAPAVVQASLAGLLSAVLPGNTPVVVETAARTASVVARATQAQTAANVDTRLAGYVDAVSNSVSIQSPSGRTAAANAGTTFAPGTTFNTGADGRAVLKFADGQIVVLGADSVLTIDQYKFDPSDLKTSSSTLDLVNGAMRYISGYIHAENKEGVSISAGASIIDILNTGPADFTVVVNTKTQEVGVARVALGEISAHTPYGPIDKIKADQSSLWGPKTATSTIPVSTSLAVVQAAVSLQLSGLPENTPAAVVPAAQAAAAVAQAAQAETVAKADPQNARLQAEAKAAAELADSATKTATATGEAVLAKVIATTLEALAPTAAGPALAQAPATQAALQVAPAAPTVTPGAAGGSATDCRGSCK
jgi:hypothetical protein